MYYVNLPKVTSTARILDASTELYGIIGSYGIVLNEAHYKDLLFEAVPPPAVLPNKNTSNLVTMGFPRRLVEDNATFCVW